MLSRGLRAVLPRAAGRFEGHACTVKWALPAERPGDCLASAEEDGPFESAASSTRWRAAGGAVPAGALIAPWPGEEVSALPLDLLPRAPPSYGHAPPAGRAEAHLVTDMSGALQRERIAALGRTIMSEDPRARLSATAHLRVLLSARQDPPIREVVDAGVVPRLVQLLSAARSPDLQLEAAWVLTNITSGSSEDTRVVVEHDAVPALLALLESPVDDIREQAVWALGNIAGDSADLRDVVLRCGGLRPLTLMLHASTSMPLLRIATWTLSNLCRGKPPPPLRETSLALSALASLVGSGDVDLLADVCWALAHISGGSSDHIAAVLDAGLGRRLVELLLHPSILVQESALRAVGNIVAGDDEHTQAMLESGVAPALSTLLSHDQTAIQRECCWAVSNILAGGRGQIQHVINAGLIPQVARLLEAGDPGVREEAAWAISNAACGGSIQQVELLVKAGCIKLLLDLAKVADGNLTSGMLQAVEIMLRVGRHRQQQRGLVGNPFATLVAETGGLQALGPLQEHPHKGVRQKVVQILESYFPTEEGGPKIAGDAEQ